MKIEETDINIVPLLLELVGAGVPMGHEFMSSFDSILALRGIKTENQEELEKCVDAFIDLGLVEVYKGKNNKYLIRKSNG